MKKFASRRQSGLAAVFGIPLLIIAAIVLIPIIAINVTPAPGSLLIRMIFNMPPQPPPPDLYYSDQVQVTRNIKFGDAKDEVLDLYQPKAPKSASPLIIWVHGGAFVGGDKRDVAFFAEALAYNGYAVACINYTRAPEGKYPTPVLQTGEAYTFLTKSFDAKAAKIDTGKFYIAGDSAGAHIAAQFSILQSNPAYRKSFMETHGNPAFPDVISSKIFRGALLFCGPYSVERMANVSNPLMKFLVSQTGWAYFGSKDFTSQPVAIEANLIQHVTKDFPPSFVTDGNVMTFPEHAEDLIKELKAKGVFVDELFFDGELEIVEHEFQFDLLEPAGRLALERTLAFLRKN